MNAIQIQPYAITDAERAYKAMIDSRQELAPWMPWCHPAYAIEETRSWLEEKSKNFAEKTEFQMCIIKDDQLIGGCGLNALDSLNKRANLGYWIHSSFSKKGYATEAVRLLKNWAFANTDLVRLEIVVAVGNIGSSRVAVKAGAHFEGVAKARLMLHDVAHDANIYSFT
jgi:ribosomal-protein-serine acetyltransferase